MRTVAGSYFFTHGSCIYRTNKTITMEIDEMKKYENVKEQISKLTFEECIKVYELLELQHPIIDFLFERMNELDSVRFDEWL